MKERDRRLVDYLKDARETELALLRALESHLAVVPRGVRRDLLRQDVEQTRVHVRWVEGRLLELGVRPSRRSSAVHALRSAVRRLGAAARLGRLLKRAPAADVLLESAKRGLAIEGRSVANYFAIESVARLVGDHETADLAAEIRADEESMLEAQRREIPELAGAGLRAEVAELSFEISLSGGWWAYEEISAEQMNEALARVRRRGRG